ncbi:MAG TPA: TonB-dependent receptor [Woeseiaceae bacterium]|nr:TonB-dependent receptor [Woeseiaceae bacterium]
MARTGYGALLALLLSCSVAAQATDGNLESEIEADIVVTATRTPMPIEQAIVPVTVITRQDIEQSLASDLAELLRFEAGIEIGRNGGPGQGTSVFMRGTESNHTLVLIDGVRINPGTVGGAAVHYIAPELIERIEIVKGARSALFGTDAIGGVINVITRRRDHAWLEASLGGGSFNTRSAYAAAGRRTESGDIGLGLNLQDTDGFPARTDTVIDRGYENLSANFHAGKRFGDHYISLRHWRAAGSNEYFDFFLTPLDQDFRNASSALELRSDLAGGLSSKLVVSHILDEIEQNQSADFVRSKRNTLDWQLDWAAGDHRWIGGLYLVDENAAAAAFGSGFDADTKVRAVFLENLWARGPHRTFTAVRLTDHDTFGNHVTWNAEYAFTLDEHWTLNAGIGHAFRAPDATDRFGFGGNPSLDPEIADEVQAGLSYRPNARHSIDLELYYNDIEDLIEFDLASFELRNIGVAEIRGAELRWEYRGDRYSLLATLVRQSAENAAAGVRLPRRAEESLAFKAVRNFGPHRLGVAVLASGDRTDIGNQRLAGYVVANLTGQLALGDRWRLNARIENLLDAQYETVAGFRMQERSAFVDLSYQWQ